MKKPLVSIAILTYQHEQYIKDCIMGILSQTYANIEVLFLDDASTDATLHIIDDNMQELKRKCTCIEMIKHEKNVGNISHNANELLKICHGSYVYLGSGDDVLGARFVQVMVEYLEKNRDCALAYCNGYIISDTWHFGEDNPAKIIYYNHKPLMPDEVFEFLLQRNYISAATVMIRTDIYKKYGYYDESIGYEDYDMWLRLGRCEKFGYVDQKLVYYRESITGLSNICTREKFVYMYNESVKILKKHLKYVKKEKRNIYIFEYTKHELYRALEGKYYDVAFEIFVKNWRLFCMEYIRRYNANRKISISTARR